jgi:hypothetical protein
MSIQEARWFVAHRKVDADLDIDTWCNRLQELLKSPGWSVCATAGRDDYDLRARAMGGWHRWCDDVPAGTRWDDAPLFHGIVVPTSEDSPIIGRATSNLVEGFLREGKYAFLWCPCTEKFSQVQRVDLLPDDNWQMWARLVPQNGVTS